jgi:HK97 family phage major capsid protein
MKRPAQELTLADYVGAVIGAHTIFDDGQRAAVSRALTRTGMPGYQESGSGVSYGLPANMSRSILPDPMFMRTGVEAYASGPGGLGFTVKPDFAPEVVDKKRTTFGPVDQIDWWEVPTREYLFPAVNETSRATGSRWGGFQATWGLGETNLPAATDGKVANIRFIQNRLLIYTTVSRDIWEDSTKLERWLNYIALSEVRFSIELAIVNGTLDGPQSIITSPATVVVAKESGQSSGTIVSKNIDKLWSAMSAGSKRNACWYANDDTIWQIDQIAVSGQWPEIPYIPAGMYGNAYPTLKGRPLIPCEACPAIGLSGDLICADLSDYIFTYLKSPTGGISISVDVPAGKHATGMIGLPEGAVERRMSDQVLFTVDELAIVWKFRGDGQFLWKSTMTNINGASIGPCAVIAPR